MADILTVPTAPTPTSGGWQTINRIVEATGISRETLQRGVKLYRESGGRAGLKHHRPNEPNEAGAPKESRLLRTLIVIHQEDLDRWMRGEPPLGAPAEPAEHRPPNRSGGGVPARRRTRKPTPAA